MSEYIAWSDIEAEAGDYRAGFVAIFRKYEGLATDEVDGHGARVRVTAESFSRHFGVVPRTFRRWLSTDTQSVDADHRAKMDTAAARKHAAALPPERKAEIVKELIKSDPTVAAAASRALEERNAALPAPRVRERSKSDRYSDALTAMRAADAAIDRFANAVSGGQWTAVEADSFETILARWSGAIDLIRTGLRSGSWDDELAKLTRGSQCQSLTEATPRSIHCTSFLPTPTTTARRSTPSAKRWRTGSRR